MSRSDVIIIGGGASVKKCEPEKLHRYGTVIGVNDSGIRVKCDHIVSMDRLWMEHNYKECELLYIQTWFRKCAWKKHMKEEDWYKLNLFDWKKDEEMSEETSFFNGDNSGACALNLAYHMRPKRIFLFGFDMNNKLAKDYYWYKPYEWVDENKGRSFNKLREWTKAFDKKKKQFDNAGISVFNVSEKSAIQAFEKISYEDFIRMVSFG